MTDSFAERGFALLDVMLSAPQLCEIDPLFSELASARAGYRLPPARLDGLASIALIAEVVAARIGPAARPVRTILLDKHGGNNWALGWHQDRTIEVATRIDTAGFGPWTIKAGRHHVAPPIALLATMVTVRVHLDPVDAANAPLLVAPGSHRLGVVSEPDIQAVVDRCGTATCLAERGAAWLYSTPILHSSGAAVRPRRRRVLQIDFAAFALPNGLCWAASDKRR